MNNDEINKLKTEIVKLTETIQIVDEIRKLHCQSVYDEAEEQVKAKIIKMLEKRFVAEGLTSNDQLWVANIKDAIQKIKEMR